MGAAVSEQDFTSDWRDVRHVNRRRAFVLMGAGCVAGLLVAGVSLFTAKGASTLIVPPDAVATVNQQPVSRIDFDAQLRALGLDPAHATRPERQRVLEDMIREELFVQRGKELDVATVDPEVRSAIVKSVEAQAAANAITSRPTEDELRAYYDAHPDRFASEGVMELRDLVFPAASASAARAALASGVSADGVLARFGGRDTARVKGEEFYFAARIHLGPSLYAAALALRDGDVSAPIVIGDEVHVLTMLRNRPPVPYPFDRARAQVASARQTEAIARYEKADADFLRKRANVLIASDLR